MTSEVESPENVEYEEIFIEVPQAQLPLKNNASQDALKAQDPHELNQEEIQEPLENSDILVDKETEDTDDCEIEDEESKEVEKESCPKLEVEIREDKPKWHVIVRGHQLQIDNEEYLLTKQQSGSRINWILIISSLMLSLILMAVLVRLHIELPSYKVKIVPYKQSNPKQTSK